MNPEDFIVFIVDNVRRREALSELLASRGTRHQRVTLQIHRSKIMQKMEAASLADLVRIAEKLQIPVTHSRRAGNT